MECFRFGLIVPAFQFHPTCTMMRGWMKGTATVSIYTPWHSLSSFPYTLGCMVARTTNALAVANGPPTVWETLAN